MTAFGTKKLDKALAQMSQDEKDLFLIVTKNMEYSYQLKMVDHFLEEVRALVNFKPQLMEAYFKTLKKNKSIEKVLNQFSSQKRLALGVGQFFFNYLKIVKDDEDYLLDLKKRIKRNNLKSWKEYFLHASLFQDAREFGNEAFDYSAWTPLLALKDQNIKINQDTYKIHFLNNCKELFSFGMKFNSCLAGMATYKTNEVNEGEHLFCIVFKNEQLFSSLSIQNHSTEDSQSFSLIDMRTFNNEFVDEEIKSHFDEVLKGVTTLSNAA